MSELMVYFHYNGIMGGGDTLYAVHSFSAYSSVLPSYTDNIEKIRTKNLETCETEEEIGVRLLTEKRKYQADTLAAVLPPRQKPRNVGSVAPTTLNSKPVLARTKPLALPIALDFLRFK